MVSFLLCAEMTLVSCSPPFLLSKTPYIQSYLFDPAKAHFVPVGLDTRCKIVVLNVILSLREINTITLLGIDR